jgi:hypothetical protein
MGSLPQLRLSPIARAHREESPHTYVCPGFAWPKPRDHERAIWVEAERAPTDALRGYPIVNLPYWLDDELWSIELAGDIAERDHVLLARRARLLAPIEAWGDPLALALALAEACGRRVARQAAAELRDERRADAAARLERAAGLRELERAASELADDRSPGRKRAGYVADVCFYARDAGLPARAACVVAKMTAYALADGSSDTREYDERVAKERTWQAAWLAERLSL